MTRSPRPGDLLLPGSAGTVPAPRGAPLRSRRYKPLFPTAVAELQPPPGPSCRSPWAPPPPGLPGPGRALLRGGSRPQPALILGGAALPAGAGQHPPPGDGATLRQRLGPSASSGLFPGPGTRGGAGNQRRAANGARRWRQDGARRASPPSPWRPAKQRGRAAFRGPLRRRFAAAVGGGEGGGRGAAMEGGGNSKGTGLGGLFGAGGLGYSHADLAGVPREYRGGWWGRLRGSSVHAPAAAGPGGRERERRRGRCGDDGPRGLRLRQAGGNPSRGGGGAEPRWGRLWGRLWSQAGTSCSPRPGPAGSPPGKGPPRLLRGRATSRQSFPPCHA